MTGDVADIVARLKATLPARWFADTTPVLDTLLTGLADAASRLYELLATARLQTRIATAAGGFLDLAAEDFFGTRLRRQAQEGDDGYRARILQALARTHGTRAALATAITELTGTPPTIFEPARPSDTGAYAMGSLAWNTAGGWGSLSLPFQSFVTITRPSGEGIGTLAGYGTGGPVVYADLSMVAGQVTDADIYTAVADCIPVATIAWTCITG